MDDIELIILQDPNELDQLDCPVILVRTETDSKGKYSTNCSLGDEKCLRKGFGQVIVVRTSEEF